MDRVVSERPACNLGQRPVTVSFTSRRRVNDLAAAGTLTAHARLTIATRSVISTRSLHDKTPQLDTCTAVAHAAQQPTRLACACGPTCCSGGPPCACCSCGPKAHTTRRCHSLTELEREAALINEATRSQVPIERRQPPSVIAKM